MVGRVVIAAALGLGGIAVTMAAPTITEVDAAGCVRITGGVFNSPGNDNYMPYLNQEYVVIKNVCSTSKLMTGYKVHDYGKKHIYAFPSGYRIGAGVSVKLRSGTGTNGTYNLYWHRSYGAVWNNTPPERAYLKNPSGTTISSWSPY